MCILCCPCLFHWGINYVFSLFHICFNGLLSYFVGKEPFVGLVLHSGLESSLPSLPTSTKLANRDKYKNIKFIDIAYTIEEKLYRCQMNETAKKQIKSFVGEFYIRNEHKCLIAYLPLLFLYCYYNALYFYEYLLKQLQLWRHKHMTPSACVIFGPYILIINVNDV